MKDVIARYFAECKIEYYATLSYSYCRELSREIMEREGFTPRSVIVFLVPYYVSEGENISAYATSLDYHMAIREITDGLVKVISEHKPDARLRGYGDHSPIDEVHAALIGGLGIMGDNHLLINEKYGSYIFIGDVVTDIDPSEFGGLEPRPIGECLHCGACHAACPTGILRGEARDCLSAITQRKGELLPNEIDLMLKYNTVWGCDECQRACPYNSEPMETPIDFFRRERITRLTTEALDGMGRAELRARAFGWRGRTVLERNLALLGDKK